MLDEAKVAVYPVDPAGLAVDSLYSARVPNGSAIGTIQAQTRTGHMVTANNLAAPGHATMQSIAKQTGGLAFFNANDLADSIRRAVDDARFTYTLGFYPPEALWDGKYHRVRVTVKLVTMAFI